MAPLLILLQFSFLAAGGSKPAAPVNPEPTPINRTLLLQLVNDARKKGTRCGDAFYPATNPVSWNSKLEMAATVHSNDMYVNNYFSHASRDGKKAGTRLEKLGYNWLSYGENIAFGQRSEREVMQGWLSSPGHCKNIMSKTFKEMGVSRVGDYWTQVFATK